MTNHIHSMVSIPLPKFQREPIWTKKSFNSSNIWGPMRFESKFWTKIEVKPRQRTRVVSWSTFNSNEMFSVSTMKLATFHLISRSILIIHNTSNILEDLNDYSLDLRGYLFQPCTLRNKWSLIAQRHEVRCNYHTLEVPYQ